MDKATCHVDCLSGMGYDVPCITYSKNGKMQDIYRPETHSNKKRETVLEMQDSYVPMSTKNTITTVINDLEHDIEQDLINEKRKHRENSNKYRCLLCSRSLLKAVKFSVIGILLIGGLLTCGRETGTFISGFFPFISNILNPNTSNYNSSDITDTTTVPTFKYAYTTPDGVKIDLPVYDYKKIESDEIIDKYINTIRKNLAPITSEKVLNYLGNLLENKQFETTKQTPLRYHEQRHQNNEDNVNINSQNDRKMLKPDNSERASDYDDVGRTNKNRNEVSAFAKLKPTTLYASNESQTSNEQQSTKPIPTSTEITSSANYKSPKNVTSLTSHTLDVANYNKSSTPNTNVNKNNDTITEPMTTVTVMLPTTKEDNLHTNESIAHSSESVSDLPNVVQSTLRSSQPKNTQSSTSIPLAQTSPSLDSSSSQRLETQLPKQVSSLSSSSQQQQQPLYNNTTETVK